MSEDVDATAARALESFADEPTPAALAGRIARERGGADDLEAVIEAAEQTLADSPIAESLRPCGGGIA